MVLESSTARTRFAISVHPVLEFGLQPEVVQPVTISVSACRSIRLLANPVANFLSSLAFQRYMWVLPVEADGM